MLRHQFSNQWWWWCGGGGCSLKHLPHLSVFNNELKVVQELLKSLACQKGNETYIFLFKQAFKISKQKAILLGIKNELCSQETNNAQN